MQRRCCFFVFTWEMGFIPQQRAAHTYVGSFHTSSHLLCVSGQIASFVSGQVGVDQQFLIIMASAYGGGGGEEVVREHLGQLLKLSPRPGILICAFHPMWSKLLVFVVGAVGVT